MSKTISLFRVSGILFLLLWILPACVHRPTESRDVSEMKALEGPLQNPHQLTFVGKRCGEGYFSSDGKKIVFQAEIDPENPFYQIYTMDLENGEMERVSGGTGKTTCAYFHSSDRQILFASTHLDPESRQKQKDKLMERAHGKKKRYEWDYDPAFDIFSRDLGTGVLSRLTREKGYDAEGAYSPDGNWVVFASNRHVYAGEVSQEDRKYLKKDPSRFMELYVMRSDGSDVRRLTHESGYDGGPFFSPDGTRIVWRHFEESGHVAEIWTMNVDGSDKRQVTRLGAMSWAPFFHPSGRYIVFTTNRHGYKNFELYIVDAQGDRPPYRVTHNESFDGLPVFAPGGDLLAWTATDNPQNRSQLFLADWDHPKALECLGLETLDVPQESISKGRPKSTLPVPALRKHVETLCGPEMNGRMTGTPGERAATAYVADRFAEMGLVPAGDKDSYYQVFDFKSGVSLGEGNRLEVATTPDLKTLLQLEKNWLPLAFSRNGSFDTNEVIFGGYGIVTPPQTPSNLAHHSYSKETDLKGKWVLVLRDMPKNLPDEKRKHLLPFSSLRAKAAHARSRGAQGVLVVTGPLTPLKKDLISLRDSQGGAESGLSVLAVDRPFAEKIFEADGRDLTRIQKHLDQGNGGKAFRFKHLALTGKIALKRETRRGRNVLGRLSGSGGKKRMIIVGAHVDHLGQGGHSSSLARGAKRQEVHHGADDNASGTALVLALAERLSARQKSDPNSLQSDIVFAAWSGEELGLLGSQHFVSEVFPSANGRTTRDGYEVVVCINMDMVGRLRSKLMLQGVGSSSVWRELIQKINLRTHLPLLLHEDPYLPTDATSFYLKGIPIISAFTGAHPDYHSPTDTPEKINYEGLGRIGSLLNELLLELANVESVPDYVAKKGRKRKGGRGLRVYLGTVPDYAASDVSGLKISGASSGSPAEKAGLLKGDVIVELDGKPIADIYDFMHALNSLEANKAVDIKVQREAGFRMLKITPQLRE